VGLNLSRKEGIESEFHEQEEKGDAAYKSKGGGKEEIFS